MVVRCGCGGGGEETAPSKSLLLSGVDSLRVECEGNRREDYSAGWLGGTGWLYALLQTTRVHVQYNTVLYSAYYFEVATTVL